MSLRFAPAAEADFDRLLDLRLRALRPSLETLGRFDPVRSTQRFRASFDPTTVRLIEWDGAIVGCVQVARAGDHVEISSFFIEPDRQGQGIGTQVMRALLDEFEPSQLPLRLTVLKESPAQRLYRQHGFVKTGESEWDEDFERVWTPARSFEASEGA